MARNLRVGGFEADLVVERSGVRVVVEVKTLVGAGDPFGRIDDGKEVALAALAARLGAHRIDVVGIRLLRDGAHVHTISGWPQPL